VRSVNVNILVVLELPKSIPYPKDTFLTVPLFNFYSMIPLNINNQSYFFSVVRITKGYPDKLIYSVHLNNRTYYLSKTIGDNDCKQLDCHPILDSIVFKELCEILTEIEHAYQRRPSIDLINQQIFKILGRSKGLRFKKLI
jgi:hypothetical protein